MTWILMPSKKKLEFTLSGKYWRFAQNYAEALNVPENICKTNYQISSGSAKFNIRNLPKRQLELSNMNVNFKSNYL